MDIPSVGSPRGILELFLPGLFLLLNILLTLSFVSPDDATKKILSHLAANFGLTLLAAIPIAYCFGVSLRLLKTSPADRFSGWAIRATKKGASPDFAIEGDKFPYRKGFKKRVERYLPPSALTFYDEVWDSPPYGTSLSRFDFYKNILRDISASAAKEIYAAEALCRYVANTVYAIGISVGFLSVALICCIMYRNSVPLALPAPLIVYLLAVVIIVRNFRFLRMYEVETVFALAFLYRSDLASFTSPVPPFRTAAAGASSA